MQNLEIPHTIREIVQERDGCLCRICGSSANLSIHHIMARSKERYHDVCNLVLICQTHHSFAESGKLPHWFKQEVRDLHHLNPVKGYASTFDFEEISCDTHRLPIAEVHNPEPIEAYQLNQAVL